MTEAFFPQAFRYDAEQNHYTCPAGKPLRYEGRERKKGASRYRYRAAVAEFPNAWIKDKLGLRQFRLRGRIKVGMEALWACLTYNIQQWIRLLWRPQQQGAPVVARAT